ncbi:MAG: 16S rRNA (uracil(1498)-N(3))-methyltransferase [SAR86 cluster bacterium]|uniref:Ribosomal RNA small subunit methyltransferase E n=1 Tax=SAR86 cluster bacterium TaxID=2030880 RepID=A0A2A5CJQ3_9GAMM|nr:16S rRNA (uracil(1498)-N(3))-methyltransferase [Gammaproteobacteria bacterium AH-315-E17]PCJ43650.1 MAG: 16S rRNA (uracil(1498)-N(3))-methyltransferase [SAR86 cluster bacterium]
MRISRIYTDQALKLESPVKLDGQQAHYLSKVLRLKANAELILFNGDGYEYKSLITDIDKHSITLEIQEAVTANSESPLHTILGLGLSRGERMDLAIQKSTELGVTEIVPLFTAFSEVKLQGERLQKKLRHWQQITISACEQSGRNCVPIIHQPLELTSWCKSLDCAHKLIFEPGGISSNKALSGHKNITQVALLIGPEGGFSEQELKHAKNTGFEAVRLGPRILRTETAPVVALTSLQLLWGDFAI